MSFKMYRNSLIFLVIIATVVSVTNAQINVTQLIEDENNAFIHELEDFPPPDVWCPNNMEVIQLLGDIFSVCKPSHCLWTDINHPKEPIISNFTEMVHFNETARRICPIDQLMMVPFTSELCQPVRLTKTQFKLNYTDGSVFEFQTNLTYPLGDYIYQPDTDETVICRNKTLPNDDTDDVTILCSSHRLNVTQYEIYPNGSLYLPHLNRVVRKAYFKMVPSIGDHWTVIDVCLRSNTESFRCHLYDITEEYFKIQPDLSLWTNDGAEIVYPVGSYLMEANNQFATVCVVATEVRRSETRYLYATAFVISSVFAFLTLLVHLFLPQLNYHAKTLLCHVISLFIMYLSMTIRMFVLDFNTSAEQLVMFGVQYVSSLATFLWINVLAYELWRVFANMRGNAGSLETQGGKKRWFIAKCVYAWGIPIVMYVLIVGLSHIPPAAKYFDIHLNSSWFTSNKSILCFFYIPLFVILLENLVFFGLTVWSIRSATRGTDVLNKTVSRQLFRVLLKLLVVMGICWFAEIISWYFSHHTDEAVWYATDLINALQGVAIFIVYVCKKSTYQLLKKRWQGQKASDATKSTESSSDRSRNNSNTAIPMTTIELADQNTDGSMKISNVSSNTVPAHAAQ